jgi:hypothetical protein
MSETKHTPGPWRYNPDHDQSDPPFYGPANQPIIAFTPGDYWVESDVDISDADGRLIAASPDLLTACQFAFQALLDGELDHAEIVAVLEPAIEKALGLQAETV